MISPIERRRRMMHRRNDDGDQPRSSTSSSTQSQPNNNTNRQLQQQVDETTSEIMILNPDHPQYGESIPPSSFCSPCPWQEGLEYTCDERVEFLVVNYKISQEEGIEGLIQDGLCIEPNYFEKLARAQEEALRVEAAERLRLEQLQQESDGLSGGAIGGIVIVMLGLVLGGIVFLVYKKRRVDTTRTLQMVDQEDKDTQSSSKDSDKGGENDLENQILASPMDEYARAASRRDSSSFNTGNKEGKFVDLNNKVLSTRPRTPPTDKDEPPSPQQPYHVNIPTLQTPATQDETNADETNTVISSTSSKLRKKILDIRRGLSMGRDSSQLAEERAKLEEKMSRKELLQVLKRERERVGVDWGGEGQQDVVVHPRHNNRARTPSPTDLSEEVWIECIGDEPSVLTFEDDWSGAGWSSGSRPKYHRPDPTGDTNHVDTLPSVKETKEPQEDHPPLEKGVKAVGDSSTTPTMRSSASHTSNSSEHTPRQHNNSTLEPPNPDWFKQEKDGLDDSGLRESTRSNKLDESTRTMETMETKKQALRPSAIKQAKNMTYPQGDVTIIYTDVQGSTAFWETCPNDMKKATDIHDRIMRQCYTDHKGYEITTEGDAFNLAFQHPADALAFALQAQIKLYNADWPEGILKHPDGKDEPKLKFRGFRVRFGIHHGPTTSKIHEMTGRHVYSGEAVKIAKAVEGMCHGGQILTTMETWKAVSGMAERYLGRPQILDCGEHLLFETKSKSFGSNGLTTTTTKHPMRIKQLVPSDLAFDFFQARGRGEGKMGFDIKDASNVSGRLFPPLISKRQLTTCFLDAPYDYGRVTICFVYTENLNVCRAKNLDVLAKYVRKQLLSTAPPGYECQEDNGCWMLAFDTMTRAVNFGLELKAAVQKADDLVGGVDRENLFKVGILSGPFTSMGPHKTTGMADYFGPIVNRAARVASNCEPGQVCIGVPLLNGDANGCIYDGGSSNIGEQDIQHLDPLMRLTIRQEMNAMQECKESLPVVLNKEAKASRELTEDEMSSLRALLKPKLVIPDDSHDQDADDLLDYVFEMVDEGRTVGFVMEEVSCDADLYVSYDHLDDNSSLNVHFLLHTHTSL